MCYEGFAEDVDAVAGPDAIDCGFHRTFRASARDVAQWQSCGREAYASTKPLKFGYMDSGDDSAFCHVAIRTPEGELVSWSVDTDVTGGSGDVPHPVLSASHCTHLAFGHDIDSAGGIFDLEGCGVLKVGRVQDILRARVR